MNKRAYLFSLVVGLTLLGIVEAVSGFILWFALPSGSGRRGLEEAFWGLSRHNWISIHDWVAIALTVMVIIHLLIHWKWVWRMIKEIWLKLTGRFPSDPRSLTGKAG